jgi:hypothetical protein
MFQPVLPLVLDALTLTPTLTPGSITATITTDNRLGPLLAADIVSWNMTVTVIDGASTLVQTITPALGDLKHRKGNAVPSGQERAVAAEMC